MPANVQTMAYVGARTCRQWPMSERFRGTGRGSECRTLKALRTAEQLVGAS
jgi:hypothetical protein